VLCDSGGGDLPEDEAGAAQYGLQSRRVWDGDQWTQVCVFNTWLDV